MIASWAHHKQYSTYTRDNHIGKLFKVPNPLCVWPVRFMYKRSCSGTISDTSQHWYLAGYMDSWMYIKIISTKPRYIHILIYLTHDTNQAQGEIRATLVISWSFTWSDSLDSFHDSPLVIKINPLIILTWPCTFKSNYLERTRDISLVI
jgi:hypothetical protein